MRGLLGFFSRFLQGQKEHSSFWSPVLQTEQAALQSMNILRYLGVS